MHIEVEPGEKHVVLHLRGEFDTYYCHLLDEEIAAVQRNGIHLVVLNLRLVKFINSTALGAIIKASKALDREGGALVISRPSAFCKDIIEKVGLDRVVRIADSDEEAVAMLMEKSAPSVEEGEDSLDDADSSSVIFRLIDQKKLRDFVEQAKAKNPVHGHTFGENWAGVGRMAGLDEEVIRFTWNGGKTNLSPFDMGQMLSVGSLLLVKFRLPLLQRGYCEARVVVRFLEERSDGVKVGCEFEEIDDDTRNAVRQYAKDMAFLKEELKRATEE